MSKPPQAFSTDSDLQRRVDQASSTWNDSASQILLHDISQHVATLNAQIADLSARLQQFTASNETSLEPPSKKRKTDQVAFTTNEDGDGVTAPLLASIQDISFALPIRRKCTLEIFGENGKQGGALRAVNARNGEIEAGLIFSDIEQVTITPLPDRPTLAYMYSLLPRSPNPLQPKAAIVFSVTPQLPPMSALQVKDPAIAANLPSYTNFAPLLNDLFNIALSAHSKSVLEPNPDDFVSSIVQAHRKNERSWCTKAWVGSKEGWLYPMGFGLLFGFKKPVLWIPVGNIDSVSYTNVLQRTFNMVVVVDREGGETEEAEFSMIDQGDFGNVDAWVKRRGLQDASLSRERRAVVYGVNKSKAERAEAADAAEASEGHINGVNGEDNETELAKAERELQDREDEEEDDFDPGSEGDSDGSGSESEEEEDGIEVVEEVEEDDEADEQADGEVEADTEE